MDRVIKFRGKDDNKVWHFGSYFEGKFGDDYIFENERIVLTDNETVGQFTGFLDAGGKEIYEGDIFVAGSYPKSVIFVVKYSGSAFVGVPNNLNYRTYPIDDFKNFKVIGNVHDNPELLEGIK